MAGSAGSANGGASGSATAGSGGTTGGSGGTTGGGTGGSVIGGTGGDAGGEGGAGDGGMGQAGAGKGGMGQAGEGGMGDMGGMGGMGEGGDGAGGEGGSTEPGCASADLSISLVSAAPAQAHDHLPVQGAARMTLVDLINAGTPLTFTMPEEGTNPHQHTLTFTAQQLQVLRNGGALTMNVTSSTNGPVGNMHTHTYSIECEP